MESLELIDKYLKNDLNESELKVFNQRLESDEDFAEEVKIVEKLKLSIHELEKVSVYRKLTEISKEYRSKNRFLLTKRSFIYSAAAVILILVSIPIINFYSESNTNPKLTAERIIKDNKIKESNITIDSSRMDQSDHIIENNLPEQIKFETYLASRFQMQDSSSYGFLPDKIGEFKIKVNITDSEENTYKYVNGKLYLRAEFDFKNINIYEEVSKDGLAKLYLRYDRKVYQIKNTIRFTKLILADLNVNK